MNTDAQTLEPRLGETPTGTPNQPETLPEIIASYGTATTAVADYMKQVGERGNSSPEQIEADVTEFDRLCGAAIAAQAAWRNFHRSTR